MALTNADFRSLIKAGDKDDLDRSQYNNKRKVSSKPSENESKKESRKLRYIQLQKKKQENQANNNKDDEAPTYRDRAEERRKLQNESNQSVIDETYEMSQRTVEESKYLGGDIDHTHLVKGLDYALLTKVRSDLQHAQLEAESRSLKTHQENQNHKIIPIKTKTGQSIHKLLIQQLHPHNLAFREKLNQYNKIILKGLRFKGNADTFLPGRTCYLYDVGMDMIGEDTPIIVFNPIEDCPKPKKGLPLNTNPQLINDIGEILRWHAANRKKKKNERMIARPGSSIHVPLNQNNHISSHQNLKSNNTLKASDEDDIYSGIGSYNPDDFLKDSVNYTEKMAEETQNKTHTTYKGEEDQVDDDFNTRYRMDIIRDDQGMELDDADSPLSSFSMAAQSSQPPPKKLDISRNSKYMDSDISSKPYGMAEAGMTINDQDNLLKSVYKHDEQALRIRSDHDEREKDPAYISDNYMECYPDYGADISYEAYDSDDDEDRSKMDMGRVRQFGAKKRDFFSNREDWEDYQSNKEALPKAAFQYGRKMNDNRITRRKKKLNPKEEWKKIEKVIGDKAKVVN